MEITVKIQNRVFAKMVVMVAGIVLEMVIINANVLVIMDLQVILVEKKDLVLAHTIATIGEIVVPLDILGNVDVNVKIHGLEIIVKNLNHALALIIVMIMEIVSVIDLEIVNVDVPPDGQVPGVTDESLAPVHMIVINEELVVEIPKMDCVNAIVM